MTSKHTPGPWRYKPHSPGSNYMLIFCSSREGEGDNLRGYCGEANARLIAAAPELLEALERASAMLARFPQCDDAWKQTRAAIAKAKGQ